MDQDTARTLFSQGACLVILDAPQGIEFGIDLDTWETGPLFNGLKMIPPGIHYIHYSANDKHGETGMRCGFFHAFGLGELVVRRWDAQTEQLNDLNTAEDVERIRANLRDLDPRLGAYPVGIARDGEHVGTSYARWTRLSNHITASMVARVLPSGGCFSSATGSVYEDEEMERARKLLAKQQRSSGSMATQESFLENIATDTVTDKFEFPLIDIRHSFPQNAEPALIRQYSVDKTWLLCEILRTKWNGRAAAAAESLLGEFQLSFLAILVGQNFTGLEHWKRLMHLVLGSSSALENRELVTTVFVPLLNILRFQLDECPEDFVAMVFDQDENFVASLLSSFVLNLYECPCENKELDRLIGGLRTLLADKFEWTLPCGKELQEEADMEAGEYAPQIVDL
ncbi:hypothetical protein IW140_002355 [Coemansia sp. RSA 1813]|nr:hypothetical protein EV178_002018 [Coemansia sp. RSA 1646]KAJ1771828.1 hypothetical protein LPJ74_002002 [Coemansia sp. RSA 1843]KAJ2090792.1 hypothetical protein IW138_002410 [Coemansia sp. RSA 986]KAJ2216040.1 hypothetical protein EV179_001691 [Coemansia sp. RSA 487]KAJ2570455.1 hypothetical protein IW140_002355 [Coemansia sp. RSA 1813]